MSHVLRDVSVDFVGTAPLQLRFTADVPAPAERIFAALVADPQTWSEWFPSVRGGSYPGTGTPGTDTPGIGSRREVRTWSAGSYRETVVAWTEPTWFAYRIDESSMPMARALVEEWRLEPHDATTTVTWTFASDPTAVFRGLLPVARPGMEWAFQRAMRNLGAHLARAGRT